MTEGFVEERLESSEKVSGGGCYSRFGRDIARYAGVSMAGDPYIRSGRLLPLPNDGIERPSAMSNFCL